MHKKIKRQNKSKIQLIKSVLIASVVLFILIEMSTYSATLQVTNNKLTKENKRIENQIETIAFEIEKATNVATIEKIATKKYGMVYPDQKSILHITSEDEIPENLKELIRQKAYED